jgi:subtilisin-like proprotein convertase family protein
LINIVGVPRWFPWSEFMTKQCTFVLLSTLAVLAVPASTRADLERKAGQLRHSTSTAKGELVDRAFETAPEIHHGGETSGAGSDCNDNGVPDDQDISNETSEDCDGNNIPDECDLVVRTDYGFAVDPPEPIIDGVTLSRTFVVPERGRILDIDLGVTLTHEFLGDLVITLTHGDISVDVVQYGPCGDCPGDCGFGETVFDDEASAELPCVDMNDGIYLPVEALSAFDGMDAAGDWTLEVFDGFIGYEGALTAWSVSIESTRDDCNDNGVPDGCEVMGEDLDQWASTVLDFSSEFAPSPMNFSSSQALGPPDVGGYCECGGAWNASQNDGTVEFISVGFDVPVFANGVTIRENQGNGFVTRVELLDVLGDVHLAWEGVDPSPIDEVVNFRIDWPRTDFLVTGVTIHTDTSLQLNTWEAIDAIQLHGALPSSADCNINGVPDECDVAAGSTDCNANNVPDDCDIAPLGPMSAQWASEVIDFSSQFGFGLAEQALGTPNKLSWIASQVDGSLEFITVGYAEPAYATGVIIRETGGHGMVYQVDVLDTNDVLHTVWQGVDPTPQGNDPADFEVSWPITSFVVKGVKVYTDTSVAPGILEAIDAIQLHGRLASDCNDNGVVDWCEFGLTDCNNNGLPDHCDANLAHHDCCEVGGCNDEAVYQCVTSVWPHCAEDWDQVCADDVDGGVTGTQCGFCEPIEVDCNDNGIPDSCDVAPLGTPTDQWASDVISFTSESLEGGEAFNALGEPDDITWAPEPIDGSNEFLTVGFTTPVYATGVTVREFDSPGFVYQVDVVDMHDELHTVWQGVDPGGPCCGVDVMLTWTITSYEVKGVRIHVDTDTGLELRETIDAIQLHGLAGSDCNNNGTNDWCEVNAADCNDNGVLDDCELADFNGDSDVDLADYFIFHSCFEGPDVIVSVDCDPGDSDCDQDVDASDWARFQNLFADGGASAADLNLSVRSDNASTITAGPGAEVAYVVYGVLTDTANEGLALFMFDLEFDGGPLLPALSPTDSPLDHFATDKGINNPAGFGGTPIDGRLVQVGGGQNTIGNTVDLAPYPIGDVVTGIGHTDIILVAGTLTAPPEPGTYTLTATNTIANVIKAGETGDDPFWETEAAGAGTVTTLTIEVVDDQPLSIIESESVPPSNGIDARRPTDIDGNNPVGWDSINLLFSSSPSGLTAADFAITSTSGTAPGIADITVVDNAATLELDSIIPVGAWTTFTHIASDTSVRLGYLPADVDNNGTSGPLDILALIDGLNGVVTLADYQADVDRSLVVAPLDILAVIDLLNGAGAFDSWIGVSLP